MLNARDSVNGIDEARSCPSWRKTRLKTAGGLDPGWTWFCGLKSGAAAGRAGLGAGVGADWARPDKGRAVAAHKRRKVLAARTVLFMKGSGNEPKGIRRPGA